MSLLDDLKKNVDDIVAAKWNQRDGRVVPDTASVGLIGDAVRLTATFLYTDLIDSSTLATKAKWLAAEVFQVFLSSMTRIIRSMGGEIRSFDGDRVMGVFIGDSASDSAAKCGLHMKWAFNNIIKPKIEGKYSEQLGGYSFAYCTGIDSGEVWAVRGGARNNNDLIWIGRPPNLAAKLSEMRTGYSTYITGLVFDKLTDDVKLGGSPPRSMWEERQWPTQAKMRIYRSNWTWKIS
jgi:class 3 adenylate cyclase